ncbi:hypothetical protein [Sphingomicrobium nitratireducens]|uniref:hypothetical protein n=1 Tax=Sphingomicrobium nitratireducens TaxID=2964666 RepID=UPI0022401446|nr:hypothetical protein [Sphingomicrobium nitratireducens]
MARLALAALAIAAPFALCACGDTSTTNDTPIEVRSEAQDKLSELSAMNRDIAMRRAITGAGFRCQRVTRSGYVTDYENLMMWTASCDDGRDWAVFIGADDTAQIRECKDVVEAGLPACEITAHDSTAEVAEPPID